jgi:regulator of protease activity HflC (stomatin/prohibitin superfamily)
VTAILTVIVVLAAIAVLLAGASVRVLREYERGVVFRLGRLLDERGPGLILLIPVVDRMVRVGLRTVVLNIPPQEVITRDNVPARVNAVTYFRIIDANRSINQVEDYEQATSQLAQTTLRSILGKAELDTLLAERERLNADLQQVIDEQTEPWGIKVTSVEIKDVEIPAGMQRAIARQAEAERERRAKIINAEGEFQASAKLADAADVISRNPVTIQLRYLQTLLEMGGGDQRSTVVFPLPIDLLRPLLDRLGPQATPGADDDAQRKREQAAREAGQIAQRSPSALPEGAVGDSGADPVALDAGGTRPEAEGEAAVLRREDQ